MKDTITVIGGGPMGLDTATRLTRAGWQVTVLEEHKEIGQPTNCSGLISVEGLNHLGLDVSSVQTNRIYGARIHAPDGTTLTVRRDKPVAYLVDRCGFDEIFEKEAEKAGVQIERDAKYLNTRGERIFYQKDGHGDTRKTQFIVGADGVRSQVREGIGMAPPQDAFVTTYQETVRGDFEDTKLVEVYLADYAKGLFAWVIPESKTRGLAGIGVKIGQNAAQAYQAFKEREELEFEKENQGSFLIPVGPPLKSYTKDNVLLVGDAAYQTKATTGGGLMLGLRAARHCATAIDNHLKHKKPLSRYNRLCKNITRELKVHWNARKYLDGMTEAQTNKLFHKLKNARIEEFLEKHGSMDNPASMIGAAIKTPRLWPLAPIGLKLLP